MSPSTLLDRILWTQLARVVHGSPPEWEPGTASARAIRGVLAETTLDLDESAIVDRWDPGGEASRVLFDRLLQARVNRAVHAGLRVEAEKLGPAETPKPSKVLIVREGAPEEELEKTAPWRLHPKKTVVEFLAGAVGGFLACMLLSGCGAGVAGVVAASGNNGGGGTAPTVLTSFRIPNPRVSPAVLQLGITGTAPVQAALFYKRPGESRQPMTRISGLGGSNSVLLAEPGADLSWDFAAEPLLEGTHFVDEVTVEVEFPGGVIPDGGVLEPEPGIGNDPPVIEDVLVPTGGVSSGVIPVGVRVSDTSSDVLSITFEWRRQGESDDDWKPATPAGLFPDEEPLEGIQASPEGISRTVSWDAMADLVDENADVELRFTPDDGTRDAADNPVGRGESMLSSPFRVENHSNPALNAFLVQNPKTSPARLVLDASQALRVAMSFDAGQGERAVTQLSGPGITGNEVDLPAGETQLDWDFASEFGTASFIPDVRLIASFSGSVISGGELVVDLGNDAPVIAIEPAASEVSGVVPIQLIVFDTSDDIVSIFAEFDIQGDSPDAGWRLARPGGLDPATPTPFPTLAGILAPANGTELVFFWDTGFDLEGLDREVVLRFTPSDGTLDTGGSPVGIGQPATTALFRVKNNAAPIVQILNDVVIANSDERRGIPIPFRALDAEQNVVEVTFQWRHDNEEFPSLDTDGDGEVENQEIDSILADPELRQEKRICTPYPHFAQGRTVPIDATTVRLPELASSEAWILASGIEGKTLELLRPSSIPAPVTPRWSSNMLVSPLAALPLDDGLTALVLDAPGAGRLREVELATGAIVREIAVLGPGIPSAMAFERRGKAVLVALDDAGTWRIERVELASGAITGLIVSDGTEPAPVRGIASLGTNAAVFTAGGSLLRLDYGDPLVPRLARLLTGLSSPWGVVVDPLPSGRLYLAERDADRILALELDSSGRRTVVAKTADLQLATVEAPESLALEHDGSRMLITTEAPGGGRQLVGLELGASGENVLIAIGAPSSSEIRSLATGPEGLRLVSVPASDEILVAGGIEQRRTITGHSTSTQDVSVQPPLDPVASAGQPWHILEDRLRGSAQGVAGRFVWDSADAGGLPAFLRAIGRDDAAGPPSKGAAGKQVRSGLDVDPLVLGGSGVTDGPFSVDAADLDSDGDQDIVAANRFGGNLAVFFQVAPGTFESPPLVLDGLGVNRPVSVAAADLDSDGDVDLAAANESGGLTAYFQTTPGGFQVPPLVISGPGVFGCFSVAASDLDSDGDQDLVAANTFGNSLLVFFQTTPGSFRASPLVLGAGVIDNPFSVAAADLDDDGDKDIVSGNWQGAHNLTVFFQTAPGIFQTSPLVLGGLGVTSAPLSVGAADLDSDGDQDIFSGNTNGGNLTVFFQTAPGAFQAAPLVLGGLSNPRSVAAADLDGDGDQDLVSNSGGHVAAFYQLSRGAFQSSPDLLGAPGVTTFPVSVVANDLDSNGKLDLVAADLNGNRVAVFLQDTPGSFDTPPLVLGGPFVTNGARSVAAGDLDSDGDQDLVVANSGSSDNLAVFFQAAPGSFQTLPVLLGGRAGTDEPNSVAAADLDSDGDTDIVVANESGHDLTLFYQAIHGGFQSPQALGGIGVTTFPLSVAADDLDSDGDMDLVTTHLRSELAVFFQLGQGSFQDPPLVLGGPGVTDFPVSFVADDLDSDGDQDLVSANSGGSNLTVFFQAAPGSFQGSPLILGGPGLTDCLQSISSADLDGDGDQDLLAGICGGVGTFFQLVNGNFGAIPLTIGGGFPASVDAADLDSDGDQDLLAGNFDDLSVFFQATPGRFRATPLVIGAGAIRNPTSIVAADLDSDGDQDLASANFDGSNLTIFWGGR